MRLIQYEDPDIITGYNIFGLITNTWLIEQKNYHLNVLKMMSHLLDHRKKTWSKDGCGCVYDRFMDTGRLDGEKSFTKLFYWLRQH